MKNRPFVKLSENFNNLKLNDSGKPKFCKVFIKLIFAAFSFYW